MSTEVSIRLIVHARTGLHVVNTRETVTVEGTKAAGGGAATRSERDNSKIVRSLMDSCGRMER